MKQNIIAIDFDGTITEEGTYPIMGKVRNDAIKYINKLHDKGYILVLWTARKGKYFEEAVNVINEYNLPLILPPDNVYGKIEAAFYIDDRSLIGKLNWKTIYKYIIKNIKEE